MKMKENYIKKSKDFSKFFDSPFDPSSAKKWETALPSLSFMEKFT